MPDLGHDKENQADTGSGAAPQSRISRRQVMTASAVVAGVGLASVPARAEAGTGGQAVSLGELTLRLIASSRMKQHIAP